MKITCDSCSSKYSIADSKVRGRKVKVRCKNCGHSILVDGTQLDAAPAHEGPAQEAEQATAGAVASAASGASADYDALAAGEPAAAAAKKEWSVNLSDNDSREMDTAELVKGWQEGWVTSDAYVWKDGMGDWKPVLEVRELKDAFGVTDETNQGVVSSAAAAPASDEIGDLFGGVDFAGDGNDEPSLEQAAGQQAPKTGERNESSVLFSLDSLKGGASPSPVEESKTSADDIFGEGLGSGGLLTSNQDLLTAPAAEPPPAPAGARVDASAPAANSKFGLIAAGVIALGLIGGGAFFFLSGGDSRAAIEAAEAQQEEARKAQEEAAKAQKEAQEKLAAIQEEQKRLQEELKKAREEAAKKGEDPAAAEAKLKAEIEAKKKEEEEAKAAASTKARSPSSSSKPKTSKPRSPPSSTPKTSSSSKSSSSGGPKFDTSAARSALSAAAANAAACKKPGGPTGKGKVQITFAPSGRVTSSTVVAGPFGGTAVGGCIASTFRRARVPKFSGSPVTVKKSFTIR
ncbi:MAG: zinc-ribbon domain-containing protein [Polyangiaceae bacterium]|nr:zinc-ribbon domain-containing protein [Polyangiaceae bacterium]